MLLPLERLEQLKRVSYKPPIVKVSKRIAKPRRPVMRQYRLVTPLEAQEIWRRRSEGESFTTIARALFMRVPTVFYSFRNMQRRNGRHMDLRALNGRKTKTKITPPVRKMLLSQEILQAWSGLFISQRVAKLANEHATHISASTLKTFYKKHKVKFLRVSYQYY